MSMKVFYIFAFAVALGMLAPRPGMAGDVKVIANPSVGVSSVSSDDLKGVFLATKTSLSDGSHVEPVLEKGGAVHEAFVKEYLGKSDAALQTYYRSLVFTGKASMPKAFANDAEVVSYVAKTRGAIGYVSSAAGTGGVKVLEVQ
jgi:ABC-type phosphate transport system substrate-binding protein